MNISPDMKSCRTRKQEFGARGGRAFCPKKAGYVMVPGPSLNQTASVIGGHTPNGTHQAGGVTQISGQEDVLC